MQLDPDPEFIGTINNVTFPAGREAILACSVRNLGKNKVRNGLNDMPGYKKQKKINFCFLGGLVKSLRSNGFSSAGSCCDA